MGRTFHSPFYKGKNMDINEKYSYQSFKRQDFLKIDVKEFDGMKIIGSCFHQDKPYSDIFPSGIRDVIFEKCNLDNCNIPAGASIIGGTNKHFSESNDREFWLVDSSLNFIEPRDKAKFISCGLSIDPRSIPVSPLEKPITVTNDPKRIEAQKIQTLSLDTTRLKALRVEKGEL